MGTFRQCPTPPPPHVQPPPNQSWPLTSISGVSTFLIRLHLITSIGGYKVSSGMLRPSASQTDPGSAELVVVGISPGVGGLCHREGGDSMAALLSGKMPICRVVFGGGGRGGGQQRMGWPSPARSTSMARVHAACQPAWRCLYCFFFPKKCRNDFHISEGRRKGSRWFGPVPLPQSPSSWSRSGPVRWTLVSAEPSSTALVYEHFLQTQPCTPFEPTTPRSATWWTCDSVGRTGQGFEEVVRRASEVTGLL